MPAAARRTRSHPFTPRTAQRGKPSWFSADQMSQVRLCHAKRIATDLVKADATNSTIIRRALEVYQAHMESLLSSASGSLNLSWELNRLRAANRGASWNTPAHLITAGPLKSLGDIAADYHAKQPTPMDMIQADLKKWAVPTIQNGSSSDDF